LLTELGDWVVAGFAAKELKTIASCSQMHPEDAARLVWLAARAKYPDLHSSDWTFRCESRDSAGATVVRLFRAEGSVIAPLGPELKLLPCLGSESRRPPEP